MGNNPQDKNKQASPYLITKNKTQDIRQGKNHIHSFREQRTISTIKFDVFLFQKINYNSNVWAFNGKNNFPNKALRL